MSFQIDVRLNSSIKKRNKSITLIMQKDRKLKRIERTHRITNKKMSNNSNQLKNKMKKH